MYTLAIFKDGGPAAINPLLIIIMTCYNLNTYSLLALPQVLQACLRKLKSPNYYCHLPHVGFVLGLDFWVRGRCDMIINFIPRPAFTCVTMRMRGSFKRNISPFSDFDRMRKLNRKWPRNPIDMEEKNNTTGKRLKLTCSYCLLGAVSIIFKARPRLGS